MSISFELDGYCERNFWWNMGFNRRHQNSPPSQQLLFLFYSGGVGDCGVSYHTNGSRHNGHSDFIDGLQVGVICFSYFLRSLPQIFSLFLLTFRE